MADPRGSDPVPRFWAKVDKRGDDDCWLWTAGLDQRGYGQFSPRRKTQAAHRFAWVLAGNEIPDGMHLRHTCENKHCVNPRHLTVDGPAVGALAIFPTRFSSKFTVQEDGCWVWNRPSTDGYGGFRVGGLLPGPIQTSAHRFAWSWVNGPIPDEYEVDHLCRNRACVNPAHLEAVTQRENTLRSLAPTAVNARKTHCVHGHEFTSENTRLDSKGRRECRTCYPRGGRP